MGIIVTEDCKIRRFYRLTEEGLNMEKFYRQYSDQMLKALSPNTLHEDVTEVTTLEKGPHSRSSLVDEQMEVGLELSNLLDELDKKI